jgi:hypothetical protein
VIENNTIARAGDTSGQLEIKLHAPFWCESTSPAGTCVSYDTTTPPPSYNYIANTHPIGPFAATTGYTEQVIISDNNIIGGNNPYSVGIGAQNPQSDERTRDILVERNWFVAGPGTQQALAVGGLRATVRNNIFNMSNATGRNFILTGGVGQAPPGIGFYVYNNTFYSNTTSNFYGVTMRSAVTDARIINNLGWAPSSSGPVMITGDTTGIIQSNNSTDVQIKNQTPGLVSATPTAPDEFKLTAGSFYIGKGLTTVPVYSDFFHKIRPSYGYGAAEQ